RARLVPRLVHPRTGGDGNRAEHGENRPHAAQENDAIGVFLNHQATPARRMSCRRSNPTGFLPSTTINCVMLFWFMTAMAAEHSASTGTVRGACAMILATGMVGKVGDRWRRISPSDRKPASSPLS